MVSGIAIAYRLIVLGYITYRAKSHRSLTDGGTLAAVIIGFIHAATTSSLFLNLVVVFFILGNVSTKFKLKEKEKLTKLLSTVKKGNDTVSLHAQRTHVQVVANSLPATLLILVVLALNYGIIYPGITVSDKLALSNNLLIGAATNYAVATADTWSSEFGILSKTSPILITTLKSCPKGTNGGVSSIGLAAAVIGSLIIGIITASTSLAGPGFVSRAKLSVFLTCFGTLGSLIDSFVGAIFQKSYVDKSDGIVVENPNGVRLDQQEISSQHNQLVSVTGWDILDNNGVNLVSITLTTGLAVIYLIFCGPL